MKVGAGLFWLLVLVLFGGAGYFAFHVLKMKHAFAQEDAFAESAEGDSDESEEEPAAPSALPTASATEEQAP